MYAFLRLAFSLIVIALPTQLTAETQGVAYFAAQGFSKKECKKALSVFNGVQKPALAILWGTFNRGNFQGCAQRFLHRFSDKKHYLQIHFSNESARALKRAGPYELLHRLSSKQYNRQLEHRRTKAIKAIAKRAKNISQFISENGNQNTVFMVSTGLEDRLTSGAYLALTEVLKMTLPKNTVFIRNKVGAYEGNTFWGGASFIELHGLKPKFKPNTGARCIANFDGDNIRFFDNHKQGNKDKSSLPAVLSTVRKLRKRGCFVFWWWPGPQGRGKNVKFVDPRKRVFQFDSRIIAVVNKNIKGDL